MSFPDKVYAVPTVNQHQARPAEEKLLRVVQEAIAKAKQ